MASEESIVYGVGKKALAGDLLGWLFCNLAGGREAVFEKANEHGGSYAYSNFTLADHQGKESGQPGGNNGQSISKAVASRERVGDEAGESAFGATGSIAGGALIFIA